MEKRVAEVTRKTQETDIKVSLNLDGSGTSNITTGIGFFDHMLQGFTKHGFYDMDVTVKGDLHVDGHHTVEDTGIVLGQAISKALGDKKGIKRYGSMILPMDETLVMCAIDLCGRPYFVMDAEFSAPMVGDFDTQLVKEFFYAVSYSAAMNLHIKVLNGSNDHHKIEAIFKALGHALRIAVNQDPKVTGVPSTKGML